MSGFFAPLRAFLDRFAVERCTLPEFRDTLVVGGTPEERTERLGAQPVAALPQRIDPDLG